MASQSIVDSQFPVQSITRNGIEKIILRVGRHNGGLGSFSIVVRLVSRFGIVVVIFSSSTRKELIVVGLKIVVRF